MPFIYLHLETLKEAIFLEPHIYWTHQLKLLDQFTNEKLFYHPHSHLVLNHNGARKSLLHRLHVRPVKWYWIKKLHPICHQTKTTHELPLMIKIPKFIFQEWLNQMNHLLTYLNTNTSNIQMRISTKVNLNNPISKSNTNPKPIMSMRNQIFYSTQNIIHKNNINNNHQRRSLPYTCWQ